MDLLTLLGIAVALAMDAFAVALGASLKLERLTGRHLFRLGFHFGLFQALMPLLGWAAGKSVQRWIVDFDHWVAFFLLAGIGGKMIYESFGDGEETETGDPTRGWTLVMLSVATSIDAFAVGLSLGMLGLDIAFPAFVIGVVAAMLTLLGMMLGRRIGGIWGHRVEILGGVVLVGIGLKILFEHTL